MSAGPQRCHWVSMPEPTGSLWLNSEELPGAHPATMAPFPSEVQLREAQKQEYLKYCMGLELGGATFESESLMTTLFPQPAESTVSAVLNTLRAKNISEAYKWPTGGARSQFYSHVHKILNGINTVARNHFGDNFYAKLVYSVYDRTTTDPIEGSHLLKPDLVGCERNISKTERVSWTRDIILPVEVKSNWSDLVAHAATYAHSLFVADSHRLFSLVIAFNYKTYCLRFLVFHRGGLTSTPEMDLRKGVGWKAFVRVMIAMASWPSSVQAGMDNASSNYAYLLPFGHYTIRERFSNRPSIRGRATQVNRLVHTPITSPDSELGSFNQRNKAIGPVRRSPRLKKTVARGRSEKQIGRSPRYRKLACWETSSPSDGPPPTDLIIKDSYPLEIRNFEGDMYHDVRGQFGVPELYASYIVKSPDNSPHSTERFSPPDCTYWDVFKSGGTHKPEIRVHMYQLLKTLGKPLAEASSPHELVEGILHSMIGYLNYFKQGWLHRDISEGNIMLMTDRITREKLDVDIKEYPKLEVPTEWTECVGMLIDGDQAIRWRDALGEYVTQRFGTLPFISRRILAAIVSEQSYMHTPLDDLDSFHWVLLWFTLRIADERYKLNAIERDIYKCLQSTDPEVQRRRSSYLEDLAEQMRPGPSLMVKQLLPLIQEWHQVSTRAFAAFQDLLWKGEDSSHGSDAMLVDSSTESSRADEFAEGMAKLTYEYSGQYLEEGYKRLSFLPKTWW